MEKRKASKGKSRLAGINRPEAADLDPYEPGASNSGPIENKSPDTKTGKIKNPVLKIPGMATRDLTGIVLTGGKSSRLGFNKLQIKIGKVPLFIDQLFKLEPFCNEILIVTSKSNFPLIVSGLNNLDKYSCYYRESEKLVFLASTGRVRVLEDENPLEVVSSQGKKPEVANTGPQKAALHANPGPLFQHAGPGPIIGLYTGLKNASNYCSVVLAFDMPFISKRLIGTITDHLVLGQESYKPGANNEAAIDARIIKTDKGFEALCGLYTRSCISSLKNNILRNRFRISGVFKNLVVEIMDKDRLDREGIDSLNFFNINNIRDYHSFLDLWRKKAVLQSGKDSNIVHFLEHSAYFQKKWEDFYLR